jgi:hypothetical protein
VNPNASLAVDLGGMKLVAKVPATKSWADYTIIDFGEIEIQQPGRAQIVARAADQAAWQALNLRAIELIPVSKD